MKKTSAGATTTAGAAGGGGILAQWDSIGSMDWLGNILPALVLVTYFALVIGAWAIIDLRRRVKELETK